VADAGAAPDRSGTGPPRRLPGAVQGTERRVSHGRLVVVREGQLDQAVEVLEHLGVPLDGCLPVLVDSSLQGSLRRGDLVGMWRCVVVVVGMCCDPVKVRSVCLLPPLGEQPEVLEDVVLSMSTDPCAKEKKSVSRPFLTRGILYCPLSAAVPYVVVYRLHHPSLGLADGHLKALGLAVAC